MITEPRIKPGQIAAAAVIACIAFLCLREAYGAFPLDSRSFPSPGRRFTLAAVAVACAAVAHFRIRGWLRASLTAGVWFFYFSLLDSYIHRGNGIHPRLLEWVASALDGFAVASLVALPFVIMRHDPKPWRAS